MISQEAAKQSGRGVVPEVCDTVSFRDAIKKLKEHDVCFLCYEMCDETQDADIKTFLKRSISETTGSVAFLVGPEGGISPEEAAYAKENGISFVSLGKRILRTETAPLCVLSCIMYESDNMK
jgi:16S rRNA (uracil1498-N3)-methyltransferase